MRDLLTDPIWRGEEMGMPIPDSPHAVSVALPRWADVVGYEEKHPDVVARMRGGYPRFVIHERVRELAAQMAPGQPCLPFPSLRAAEQCATYVSRRSGQDAWLVRHGSVFGVATTPAGETALKAFWQHTGLIVSSRQAEAHVQGRGARLAADGPEPRASLRAQLAAYYGCEAGDVFLYPTGMGAIYGVLSAVNRWRPGRATAQLGFPYVDSLKVQQELGAGVVFVPYRQGLSLDEVQALLRQQPLAACFCELPSNPLLECIDVTTLAPWLRAQGVPLVVDDVVATPFNVDLRPHADVVVTSLTKYFAGTGEVMGGAVMLNPRSPFYEALKRVVSTVHEDLLWVEDAAVLDLQARGFAERMQRHNAGGLMLAERLRAHPAVEKVWYPKWQCGEAYEAVRRQGGGWSNLLSFLVRDPAEQASRVYDALQVCKGPTLGTIFTLACPFTLLAHYGELEWAESCGVSRYLIRVSVGVEEPEELCRRFEKALAVVG
ncbi:MAG: PLP-dependent transferase [Lentisphaerae bacterium]|nr:PLP-dependent transferase [Lentisphaerota bacterium]